MTKQAIMSKAMGESDRLLLNHRGMYDPRDGYTTIHENNLRALIDWVYDQAYINGRDDEAEWQAELEVAEDI